MSEEKVECPIEECKAYLGLGDLRPHLSHHLHYFPFRCGHCDDAFFTSKEKLKLHAKLNHDCLPVQGVEDLQEDKEMELQELINKTTAVESKAEIAPTPTPFASPYVVPSVLKENSRARSSPTASSDPLVTPSGPSSGRQGTKRPAETSSSDEDESKNEQRPKNRYSECQKCQKWVFGATKPYHCKDHARELMNDKGQSLDDKDELERVWRANRDHWFPNTNWRPAEAGTLTKRRNLEESQMGMGIKCAICGEPASNLQYHVVKKHIKRALIQCPHGDYQQYSLSMPKAKEHMETVHGEPMENLIDRRAEMKPEIQSQMKTCFPHLLINS